MECINPLEPIVAPQTMLFLREYNNVAVCNGLSKHDSC